MNTVYFRRLGTHVPSVSAGVVVSVDSTLECDAHVYTGIVNSIILPVVDGVVDVGIESKKCNYNFILNTHTHS